MAVGQRDGGEGLPRLGSWGMEAGMTLRPLFNVTVILMLADALTGCAGLRHGAMDTMNPGPSDPMVAADKWMDVFEDERLKALVTEALGANPDLSAAAARLRQAEAREVLGGADRFPRVEAEMNASRRQSVGESRAGSFSAGRRNNFDLGLNFAWEVDLWGRIRDRHVAAGHDTEAAEHDLAAARLSLSVNVAKGWCQVVESGRQLGLAERSLASYRAALGSLEASLGRGVREIDALDITLSRANVATAEAAVQARLRDRDTARRTLETLAGRYPAGAVMVEGELPGVRGDVPCGVPSGLLARRPDIRAAEQRAAASLGRVSAARKGLLPRISLSGSSGTTSPELRDLLDPNRLIWSIAGGLVQPVFEGGRRIAETQLAQAQADEVAAVYSRATLQAFREVESTLAAEQTLSMQWAALRTAADQAALAERLAQERYDRGQVDIIAVLESQRRAFESQSARLRVEHSRVQNRLDLVLALGGGW
jgi:outer membrane protein, multidrug efflux system